MLSYCNRMTLTVVLSWILFSFLASFVYFHEVSKNYGATIRPVKRLVARRSALLSQKQRQTNDKENDDLVNRNIFNDDRPGVKPKPFLEVVAKKIETIKKRVFVTNPPSKERALTPDGRPIDAGLGAKFSDGGENQPIDVNSDYVADDDNGHRWADPIPVDNVFHRNEIQLLMPLNGLSPLNDDSGADANSTLQEFPRKFQFHDDVDNENNDLWYPAWIRNQAQFSSNSTRFIISHHKTFLTYLYAESAMANTNGQTYNVTLSGLEQPDHRFSASELVCDLKRHTRFQHIHAATPPFSTSFLRGVLPSSRLFRARRHFRTCAVVSSSGALAASHHGAEIDAHDAVFRFNSAPTAGFQEQVGSKTTFRILNSQVLAYADVHNFLGDPLYREKGLSLLIWDPSNYELNLEKWFEKPDHDFFAPYASFREMNPQVPAFIIHPGWIWQQWRFLQRHGIGQGSWVEGTPTEQIYPNPPTSGGEKTTG